ncbi:MAG: hypothetical protein ACXWNY_15370 [Gemmatimonadaceae bacterium]
MAAKYTFDRLLPSAKMAWVRSWLDVRHPHDRSRELLANYAGGFSAFPVA